MPGYKQLPPDLTAERIAGLLRYASNSNLLDNPDFAINQRGQSEYINPGGTPAYAIDRWRMIGTLNVGDGYVIFKKDASPYGYGFFSHIVPGGTAFEGETLTLSAIINSMLVTATGQLSTTPVQQQIGSDFALGFQLDSGYIHVFLYATGGDLTITKYSLELGDVSTLDKQTVNHDLQMLICKRHFRVWKTEAARAAALNEVGLMRLESPTLGTINIGGTTYYTASAEL